MDEEVAPAMGGVGHLRRKLLILALLIAYLEERGVFPEAYFDQFLSGATKFFQVLANGEALVTLLSALEDRFNGHVFILNDADRESLRHNGQLARFARLVEGRTELSGQFTLWQLYSFRDLPVEVTNEGIWRRIRLIPFEVYIPDSKKDEKLTQKLISEAPGILNWALQGLEEYRSHGMMEPDIVKASTDDYRASQDWMTRFLGEVTEPSPEESILARKLYEKYADWCNRTGEYKLKEAKFAEGMQQKGMRSKEKRQEDGRKRMAYEGIKLRDAMSGFSMGEAPLPGLEELSGY